MNREAWPSGAEEPRKRPCSLPSRRPSYCASAVTSLSVMPGLIFSSTRAKTSSCMSAHLRTSSFSSSLLIALRRSTNSVASTNVALPASSRSTRATNLCGMAPLPTQPMVR